MEVTNRFLLLTVDGFSGAVNLILQTKLPVLNFRFCFTRPLTSPVTFSIVIKLDAIKSSPIFMHDMDTNF
jgi:hypothetical protein